MDNDTTASLKVLTPEAIEIEKLKAQVEHQNKQIEDLEIVIYELMEEIKGE